MLWLTTRQLTKSRNPTVRLRAAERLKATRPASAAAIAALVTALRDPDNSVACAAADALGAIGGSAAVQGLIDALGTGSRSNHSLRTACASALGRIGDKRAIEPLAEAAAAPLERDRDGYRWGDRGYEEGKSLYDAVSALRQVAGDRRAVEALSTFLSAGAANRRANAQFALRQIPEYNKGVAADLGTKVLPAFKGWMEERGPPPEKIDCRWLPVGWVGTPDGLDTLAAILLHGIRWRDHDYWLQLAEALDKAGSTFDLRSLATTLRTKARAQDERTLEELGRAFGLASSGRVAGAPGLGAGQR